MDHDCDVVQEHCFTPDSTDDTFIQIFIMSLFANFTEQSECSTKINQISNTILRQRHQLYFKRKSLKATVFFQQLDFTVTVNTSLITKGNYFTSNQWTIIDSEDLIQSNLTDCENVLTNFLSLLGLNTSSSVIQNILQHDSHRFIEDATWWDQSEVAERILYQSIPSCSSNFTYSNDFYYLHGDRSFLEYLNKTRQCYTQGIFTQLQFEKIINRCSTDKPDRCLKKPFDCAFSDLYSFADREQIYQPFDTNHYFNDKPVKCGFVIPSIFDQVRQKYARNHTCETIVFTSITNCYDPLPEINGAILPSFCFVALLDRKTIDAYKKFYSGKNLSVQWDLFDLGVNATPFSVNAKTAEPLKIVGLRLFPLAKWIIWLDGKARMNNIRELLSTVQAPFVGAAHPDIRRTSASELRPTIDHLNNRKLLSGRLNDVLFDISLQEQEYKRDGFYSRSDALRLKLYDIAIILYRNNHPCISRYLCAWHNEVNYYSYRGQLSVYYPAVRFNVTNYLHFLPRKFYTTVGHRGVC
jgi:hypothetical protein